MGNFLVGKKNIIGLVGTLLILFVIPVTVFLTLNSREPTSKAEGPVIRGQSGDLWADTILGKRDFTEISNGKVLPNRVWKPGGAVVDRSRNRAFIFDGHYNRIMGLNLTNCINSTATCSAASSAGGIVIGQPSDTDYGACNRDNSFQNFPLRSPAAANTVCGLYEGTRSTAEILPFVQMDVDANGRLFFPDIENHRILVYDNPYVNNASANQVIGQANFADNNCNQGNKNNPTASSLCLQDPGGHTVYSGAAAVVEPSTGDLWVADNGNNRVLRFPKDPNNAGRFLTTANLVLGRPDFVSGTAAWGSGSNQFSSPNSLAFNPTGQLFVADPGNNRIQIFNKPFFSGMSASSSFPSGLVGSIGGVDPSGSGIWLNNYTQGKLTLWSWNGNLLKTYSSSEAFGGSLGIDNSGNILAAGFSGAKNVALFKTSATNKSAPDRWIFLTETAAIENSRMSSGAGIAIAGNQLFVSDYFRVLFWNSPSTLTNGKPADGCLIQASCTAWDGNVSGFVGQIKSDASNRVWVRSSSDVKIYQAPVTSGAAPIARITYPLNVLGGGQINILGDRDGTGIVPTSDGKFLWFTESLRNRVLRIRDPLTNPKVDLVLGQNDLTNTQCNRGLVGEALTGAGFPDTLCHPGDLSIDRQGNLYVADSSLESAGNRRLLMFAAGKFPTNNNSVIFAPTNSAYDATKIFPQGPGSMFAPWEPAFDSQNRMVLGLNTYWSEYSLAYYNNPTDPAKVVPDGYIKDFNAEGLGAAFDQNDNLYIASHTRSRVLIYKTPFVEPVGNQAPTVNITSHQANTWYKGGTHTIQASVSDDYNSVARVEFYVDGNLINSDKVSPFQVDYNFSTADGNHIIVVKAYDHFDRTSQQSMTIKIDHQGPGTNVNWNSPNNGATVSGIVPVSISADDAVSGTKRVDFYVDGTKVSTDNVADTYGFWWNSSTVANGSHLIEAKAYDQPENVTVLSRTVNVNNLGSVADPIDQVYLPIVGQGTYAEYSEQRLYPLTATAQFEGIDEEVPDDQWSFVFTNHDTARYRVSGKIDSTQIPSGVSISSVEVVVRAQAVVGTPNIKIMLRNSGVDSYSDPVPLTSTEFQEYKTVWTKDPTTGSNWTASALANAEVGVQAWHATSNAHRVSSIWMIVHYGQAKEGDINGDWSIDSADLAILISTWGSSTDLRADLNNNGRVDSADLAKLISKWGS